MCDVLHLIKLVYDGDLRHVDDMDFRREMAEAAEPIKIKFT